MGAELFYSEGRTDRRTDMTKLIVALRNITNAPKNSAYTPQKTHSVNITKTDPLPRLRKRMFVHSENHREYINTLEGGGEDNVELVSATGGNTVKLPLGFFRLNLVSMSAGTKQIVGNLILVGTVCHLGIYMQSNKTHKVFYD